MDCKRLGIRIAAACALAAACAAPARAQGTDRETLEFQIFVEPVFFVETVSNQAGAVQLGPLLPQSEPASEIAKIVVHSNAGRPYLIKQRQDQKFLNETGAEFPENDMTFTVSDGLRGGRSQVTSPSKLSSEPVTIFVSNPKGEADEFMIKYFAKSKRVVPAGRYRSRIEIEGELQ